MHTYRRDELNLNWSVGYWRGDVWYEVRGFDAEKQAVCFINFLNGGDRVSLLSIPPIMEGV